MSKALQRLDSTHPKTKSTGTGFKSGSNRQHASVSSIVRNSRNPSSVSTIDSPSSGTAGESGHATATHSSTPAQTQHTKSPLTAGFFDVSIGEVNAAPEVTGIKRIPPRVDTAVKVDVTGALPDGLSATLKIEGSGHGNGSATINALSRYNLNSSETVDLTGGTQTSPGNAGKLRLAAYLGTSKIAQSNGFSVAAFPVQANFKFNQVIKNQTIGFIPTGQKYWGANYGLDIVSDSGYSSDLDQVKVTENIINVARSGLFTNSPQITGSFNNAVNHPPDYHAVGGSSAKSLRAAIKKDPGSHLEHNQLWRFACARSGIPENISSGPEIPASGFKIMRWVSEVQIDRTHLEYYVRVYKEGFAHSAVQAGHVDDTDTKDAQV